MFSAMNTHKYLEMIEISETYENYLRIVIAEAGVSTVATNVTSEQESNEALRSILNKSYAIEVTDQNSRYEVVFEDYIAYAVTNESYSGETDAKYEGRLARVYSQSAFLGYIRQGTIATFEYPGPFVHYGFCCLNQIIDIVAERPPAIKLVAHQDD